MKLVFAFAIATVAVVSSDDSQLIRNFISGNHRFAVDVYKQLKEGKNAENFLFCPFSAEIILALTQFAAKGQTAQQLSSGLHLPSDNHELENTFKPLTSSLKGNENYILASANKIFIKDGYKIRDDYKNVAKRAFDAEIENINFENENSAAQTMNNWVEKKTYNKIQNLIDPAMLTKDSVTVLINTLYFKGIWVNPFSKRDTHSKKFFLNHNDQIDVAMMEITDYYKYYESSELKAQFLEMPYKAGDISMVIVLPNDKEGLSALENKLDQVVDTDITVQHESKVHVQIPKFKEETKIELTNILKELGIKDAFEDYADFSGFGEPDQHPIKISDVIQKTFIEVDEEGSTAAAASAVFGVDTLSPHVELPPRQFIADHPFIYYIKSPAGVMFIGRYVK